MKSLIKLSALVLLVNLSILDITAQTMEMSHVPDSITSLQLDYSRLLVPDSDQSLLSGNYLLKFKHAHGKKLNFLAEINFSNLKEGEFDSESGIGNIYLGSQIKLNSKANRLSSINVGVFLPTADDEVSFGVFNNFWDVPRYLPDVLALRASYASFSFLESGLRISYELGLDLSIPTNDNNFDESELFGRYGISLLYNISENFFVNSEILGYAILSEDDGFDDNSYHTYALGLGYDWGGFRLAISYKNFFDEFPSDEIDGILGIQLVKNL